MELFYSDDIKADILTLNQEESQHCIKVLRHRCGDRLNVIDGEGTLYLCELTDANPKRALASIVSTEGNWGSHPYRLTLAVCPTKNNERYEWFLEKACELGVDVVVPVIGDHSERKIYKTERAKKILVSSAKQSLKAAIPHICEPVSVKEFIKSSASTLKLIAYCFEDETHPRISIKEILENNPADDVTVLIGPEGDFSKEEAALALENGFLPVHLGNSRLRTETAAVTAAEALYFRFM